MAVHNFVLILMISSLKTLFLKCYRSTDFEVHRNWLAIVHSLPVRQWYTDTTSNWTLDYPPFFAWFEFFLSQGAQFFDPKMLVVSNLNYASDATILFQRLSVILSDIMLAYGVNTCYIAATKISPNLAPPETRAQMICLVMCNAGLVMVDHVHFQYNGFLFGFALRSIGLIMTGNYLWSAFWFAMLLNLKHIYLYSAPVYFVFLLRHYCIGEGSFFETKTLVRLAALGSIVISVFAISFGPFIYFGQLADVLQRLFPFKRGLCHAYWAPNFWALYNLLDKVLAFGGKRFDLFNIDSSAAAAMTGGLVQEFDHTVLPNITPLCTLFAALLAMAPVLVKLWKSRESSEQFLRAVILCNFSSFLFGWHVHEKAILLPLLPMIVLSIVSKKDAMNFFLLSLIGNVSLLPLIFKPEEAVTKVLLVLVYFLSCCKWLRSHHRMKSLPSNFKVIEKLYVGGLFAVMAMDCLSSFKVNFFNSYPFLPLLICSCYCSAGIMYSWILLCKSFWESDIKISKSKLN